MPWLMPPGCLVLRQVCNMIGARSGAASPCQAAKVCHQVGGNSVSKGYGSTRDETKDRRFGDLAGSSRVGSPSPERVAEVAQRGPCAVECPSMDWRAIGLEVTRLAGRSRETVPALAAWAWWLDVPNERGAARSHGLLHGMDLGSVGEFSAGVSASHDTWNSMGPQVRLWGTAR